MTTQVRVNLASTTFELACRCRVTAFHLPLQGGERRYTCNHGHQYLISGKLEKILTLRAELKVEAERKDAS